MRNISVMSALVWLASLVFPAASPAQQNVGCVQMLSGIICPPPNGGVGSGIDGEVVCGPGQCARDSTGIVKCSSVSGGGAIVDINGNVLCVEGCVRGSRRYCVVPTE